MLLFAIISSAEPSVHATVHPQRNPQELALEDLVEKPFTPGTALFDACWTKNALPKSLQRIKKKLLSLYELEVLPALEAKKFSMFDGFAKDQGCQERAAFISEIINKAAIPDEREKFLLTTCYILNSSAQLVEERFCGLGIRQAQDKVPMRGYVFNTEQVQRLRNLCAIASKLIIGLEHCRPAEIFATIPKLSHKDSVAPSIRYAHEHGVPIVIRLTHISGDNQFVRSLIPLNRHNGLCYMGIDVFTTNLCAAEQKMVEDILRVKEGEGVSERAMAFLYENSEDSDHKSSCRPCLPCKSIEGLYFPNRPYSKEGVMTCLAEARKVIGIVHICSMSIEELEGRI